jgi:hypothetical protein
LENFATEPARVFRQNEKLAKKEDCSSLKKQETVLRNLTGLLFNYSICVATSKNLKYIWRFTMNNETKAQLQLLSDNMSNLNYDEILFRSDILLRSIELITLIKRIEPEDFDEMINGYAEVLRFYAEDLKKLSEKNVLVCQKISQEALKMLN